MPTTTKRSTFYDVINDAVADVSRRGFDAQERIDYWLRRIAEAAERDLTPERVMRETLEGALRAIYERLVEKGRLFRLHRGVSRFTVEKLRPQLRADLARRIAASADLIRLNRTDAIRKTLHRFSGWATSVPAGGSKAVDRPEVKEDLKKALKQLPFVDRRVLIDQGHKFTASLHAVVAKDGGAIAGIWRSHWRQANYNYREDHKDRDGLVYAVRGSWASERGLMRRSKAGWSDEITQPAEEPFCRCWYEYIYDLRDLPREMLTARGEAEIKRVRVA